MNTDKITFSVTTEPNFGFEQPTACCLRLNLNFNPEQPEEGLNTRYVSLCKLLSQIEIDQPAVYQKLVDVLEQLNF